MELFILARLIALSLTPILPRCGIQTRFTMWQTTPILRQWTLSRIYFLAPRIELRFAQFETSRHKSLDDKSFYFVVWWGSTTTPRASNQCSTAELEHLIIFTFYMLPSHSKFISFFVLTIPYSNFKIKIAWWYSSPNLPSHLHGPSQRMCFY
jgi:hypothetical protein